VEYGGGVADISWEQQCLHLCLPDVGAALDVGVYAASYVSLIRGELLGTSTGFPFGDYSYLSGLGYKITGLSPFHNSLSWFYMGFASYLIARVGLDIAQNQLASPRRCDRFRCPDLHLLGFCAWAMEPCTFAFGIGQPSFLWDAYKTMPVGSARVHCL